MKKQRRPATVTTARLQPAILPGRFAFRLFVVLLSALAGASITAAALKGGASSADHSAAAPCTVVATAPNDPQNRLLNAAGYIRRWDQQAGPDGVVRVPSQELRSCYNLLTMKVLPSRDTPPAGHRAAGYRE